MFVRLDKFVVQDQLPGGVEELTPAMRQQLVARALASLPYKVLNGVRKLQKCQNGGTRDWRGIHTL